MVTCTTLYPGAAKRGTLGPVILGPVRVVWSRKPPILVGKLIVNGELGHSKFSVGDEAEAHNLSKEPFEVHRVATERSTRYLLNPSPATY